jgi:hypothetical protein
MIAPTVLQRFNSSWRLLLMLFLLFFFLCNVDGSSNFLDCLYRLSNCPVDRLVANSLVEDRHLISKTR